VAVYRHCGERIRDRWQGDRSRFGVAWGVA
jgi:hypothetical protein